MSSAVTRVRTDAPSIAAIKGLLERNLVDRAIALSENRWPGSGPLVQLSYEWSRLPPAERRERLATIGPEELGRLRGVAELHPDLARVLDDLEDRGIIPPAVPLAEETLPVERELTREEQVVDAVLDLAEEQVVKAADDLEPRLERLREQLRATDVDPGAMPPASPVPGAATWKQSMAPNESSAAFLADQAELRIRAAEHADEALKRVRATIERSAERLRERPPDPISVRHNESPPPEAHSSIGPKVASNVISPTETHADDDRLAREIAARLRQERVVTLEGDDARQVVPEQVAAAMRVPVVDLAPDVMGRRAFYGGRTREGRGVGVEPGAFPRSLSGPGLTIVRGRLLPSSIQRILEGYVDIPGTKATVRAHSEALVLVLAK